MQDGTQDYLTTRELADLLRIGERKVYDLAARGEVPCVRAVGKLLFPRDEVHRWLEASREGPEAGATPLPNVIVGSHDPMLDWALRESGSGIAAFLDGSHDGLSRFLARQALACGLHVHENGGWNLATVRDHAADLPVVLVRFATRRRGLIVGKGNPLGISDIAGLKGLRVAGRQRSAASQTLFEGLAAKVGLDLGQSGTPARTEDELALRVFESRADAAFGLEAVARQYRLDFVPVLNEEFDLLVWRRAWFDPSFQALVRFATGPVFAARATVNGGYDFTELGRVRLNGSAG